MCGTSRPGPATGFLSRKPTWEDRGGLKTSLSTFLPLNGGERDAILNGIATKAPTGRGGARSVVVFPLCADHLVVS